MNLLWAPVGQRGDETGQRQRAASIGWRLSYLAILSIGLILWVAAKDVRIDMTVPAGLWFGVAVYLIVAALFIEPFYSGGSASLANAVAVIFAFVAADIRLHSVWWMFLIGAAGVSIALGMAGYLHPDRDVKGWPSEFQRLGQRLGSWRLLGTAWLVLTLFTFNAPFSVQWQMGAVTLLTLHSLSFLSPIAPSRAVSGAGTVMLKHFGQQPSICLWS